MKTLNYDNNESNENKYSLDELQNSENVLIIDNRRLVARIKDLELAVEKIEKYLEETFNTDQFK
jgi:hypothetical protein